MTSPTTNSSSSICCCRRRFWSPRAPASTGPHRITCASSPCRGPRSRQRDRAAGQLPGRLPPVGPGRGRTSTLLRVTHSHAHSHSLQRSDPAGTDGRQGRRRTADRHRHRRHGRGRALWPSQQRVDIPLPFQNSAGSAVTTEAGHVLSSSAAVRWSRRSGSAHRPTGHRPRATAIACSADRDRLRPERGRQYAAGVQRRTRATQLAVGDRSGSVARSTRPEPRPTPSTTTSGRGR